MLAGQYHALAAPKGIVIGHPAQTVVTCQGVLVFTCLAHLIPSPSHDVHVPRLGWRLVTCGISVAVPPTTRYHGHTVRSSSNLWLLTVAVVVAVLVVASVAIALLNPRGNAQELPADTPAGAVQRYLVAVQEQDYPLAHTYYSTRLQRACTVEHLPTQSRWVAEGAGRRRIELVETKTLSDGRAQVRVRITEVDVSPPFGVNEYAHDEWYVLLQEGGAWRLDSLGWPITYCPGLSEPVPRPLTSTGGQGRAQAMPD